MAGLGKRPSVPRIQLNKKIKSFTELAILNREISDKFSQYIAELAKEFMYGYIEEAVYRDNDLKGYGDENFYNRTGQFLNSVTCRKYANGQWGVLIDGRRMLGGIENPDTSMWGQHTGFDGTSSSKDLATWIDEGNNRSSAYSFDGVHFIKKTEEYIDRIRLQAWNDFTNINGL